MALRSLIMIAAALGAPEPSPAPGVTPDDAPTIAEKVGKLADSGQHASAAKLAAEGAARTDLDDADRVILGGLAGQNFELSYRAGGPLTELCGLAAVMRLVAPLDTASGQSLKFTAIADAEKRLEQAAGSGWRSVCEPAAAQVSKQIVRREPVTVVVDKGPAAPPPTLAVPRRSRARVGVGIGLFSAGAGLAVGTAAALIASRGYEDKLAALADMQDTRPDHALTERETADALAWDARYARLQNTGKALGTLAGLSLVVGVVMLALPPRHRQVARARLRPVGAGVHISF